jgi:hypothetical protein
MQCLLLLHTDEASWLAMSEDEQRRTAATFGAWTEGLERSSGPTARNRAQPPSAFASATAVPRSRTASWATQESR